MLQNYYFCTIILNTNIILMRILLLFAMSMVLTINAHAQFDDFRILGGELSNSAVTSTTDVDDVLTRMKQMGLNTVLVPVYWEFLEPAEGQMDFTLIDCTIDVARQQGLKIVPLWFGAWKNSMSCYAPAWVKKDVKRFPRTESKDGVRQEILSPYSAENLNADKKAFCALMKFIKENDKKQNYEKEIENLNIEVTD